MAGSINVYISRQKNPKLFRWCDLAMSGGYKKWQLSSYFRNRMEDMLDASLREEHIQSVDMGAVYVGKTSDRVAIKGSGIVLYLLCEDGGRYPCVRAYLDYLHSIDENVSQGLCRMIEGDIRLCKDQSEEYIVSYEELEGQLEEQRRGRFSQWVARERREALTQQSLSDTIEVRKEPAKKPILDTKRITTEKKESMSELKEEDLFGFF